MGYVPWPLPPEREPGESAAAYWRRARAELRAEADRRARQAIYMNAGLAIGIILLVVTVLIAVGAGR